MRTIKTLSIVVALTALAWVATADTASAQQYRTAIGLRAGTSAGFDVKHFVNRYNAIEGLVESRWNGVNFVGLYEWQKGPIDSNGIEWFIGVGGHIGTWNTRHYNPWFNEPYPRSYHVAGVDGIIGLEYTFRDVPINLAVDYRPSFNITEYTGFWLDNVGLSVRYAIR